MKKLAFLLIGVIVAAFSILSGCGGPNNVVRLNEVAHSIFYAPVYIAHSMGYFEEEGIKVEITLGNGANNSMAALLANQADIALMGPEANIYVAAQGRKDLPKVFGQLTKRDGSFLVGRADEPHFQWSDLKGKEVLSGRKGGVPFMTFSYMLSGHGVVHNQNGTNLNTEVEFANMVGAFLGGQGDYCTMFEPNASDVAETGRGFIVGSVGQAAGEVPYTAFTANASFLKNNKDKATKFLRAVLKGYNYLVTADINDIVAALKPHFVGISDNSIKNSILSYVAIDAWCDTPVMKPEALDRLQDIMIAAGEITQKLPFATVVDNSIAMELMK
ncbi:MAG: ABC transporter substrate-binding protein [Firmicutes bacterium]|nr:ABC transporter substrate-binding protein [Bacillota bacterium]